MLRKFLSRTHARHTKLYQRKFPATRMAAARVNDVPPLPTRENFRVAITTDEQEWVQVRDCLAAAFHDYPLYKHLIPSDNTRRQFLTQYMEADYDVAVRQGNSILLSMSIKPENPDSTTIIGGAVYVPPDGKGGWDTADDEVYFDSYVKHGLCEIDPQAFENILRYEVWESKILLREKKNLKLHTWLGYFLGIDPEYTGNGYGSAMYSALLQALGTAHLKKFGGKISDEKATAKREDRHTNTSLSKSFIPPSIIPSHCDRAACFHKRHGYRTVKTVPVCENTCDGGKTLSMHLMQHDGTS